MQHAGELSFSGAPSLFLSRVLFMKLVGQKAKPSPLFNLYNLYTLGFQLSRLDHYYPGRFTQAQPRAKVIASQYLPWKTEFSVDSVIGFVMSNVHCSFLPNYYRIPKKKKSFIL